MRLTEIYSIVIIIYIFGCTYFFVWCTCYLVEQRLLLLWTMDFSCFREQALEHVVSLVMAFGLSCPAALKDIPQEYAAAKSETIAVEAETQASSGDLFSWGEKLNKAGKDAEKPTENPAVPQQGTLF